MKDSVEDGSERESIKEKSIKGGSATLITKIVLFVLQFLSTIILARLLTPHDFGLIAMASTLTGFAFLFSNMGLSTATIQKEKITRSQISTLFWVNVVLGLFLAGLTAVCAPLLAWFYGDQVLVGIGLLMSLEFFFYGLGIQHQALLARKMMFIPVSIIKIISTLVGTAVAVVMAWKGYSYWSLVWFTLSRSAVSTVGTWIALPWKPGLPRFDSEMFSMIKFGSQITVVSLVNYFSRKFDSIVIGRLFSADALGIYSKAYTLLMLPLKNLNSPLQRVAVPALSRLQNDRPKFRKYCSKLTTILAFTSLPLVVFIFVYADPIILVVLGDQWYQVSKIFQYFAPAALLQTIGCLRGVVLISNGQADRLLKWSVVSAFCRIVAIIIGVKWGIAGIAIMYSIVEIILFIPTLIYCFRGSPFTLNDFIISCQRPFIASILTGLMCYLLTQVFFIDSSNFILVISGAILCSIFYLLITCLLPGGVRQLKEYFSYIEYLKPSMLKP